MRAVHITVKGWLFFAPPSPIEGLEKWLSLANTSSIHSIIWGASINDLIRVVTLHSTLYLSLNFKLNRAAALDELRQLLSAYIQAEQTIRCEFSFGWQHLCCFFNSVFGKDLLSESSATIPDITGPKRASNSDREVGRQSSTVSWSQATAMVWPLPLRRL